MFGGFVDLTIAAQEGVDPSATSFAWNYWSAQQFGPDSEAYLTVKTLSADAVRVCARMTNPSNTKRSGYCMQLSGNSWTIRRSTAAPHATRHRRDANGGGRSRIGITVVGSTITAWYSSSPTAAWTQIASVATRHTRARATSRSRLARHTSTTSAAVPTDAQQSLMFDTGPSNT